MKRALTIWMVIWVLIVPSAALAATLLKGVVLENATGKPLPASILAYKQSASGEWDFTGAEETNELGVYSFTYLEAGAYYLECEARVDCDPHNYYCADKYLPELYNNVPIYDFDNKTVVTIKDGDVITLKTIRVSRRPFYFDTVSNACVVAQSDGMVRFSRPVVNNTGVERWMLFWGVMDSPGRTDRSVYYGLEGSYPLGGWNWKLLRPGVNYVTFTHKIVPKALKGKYTFWLCGGNEVELPMLPYLEGQICYGESPSDLSWGPSTLDENSIPLKGARYGKTKAIPIKLSADGKVLELGVR